MPVCSCTFCHGNDAPASTGFQQGNSESRVSAVPEQGELSLGISNVCRELVAPKAHSTPCSLFAIACESNKAAVTHLLVVLELTRANMQVVTSLEVFIPSVLAT